jgi:hypothetical protein
VVALQFQWPLGPLPLMAAARSLQLMASGVAFDSRIQESVVLRSVRVARHSGDKHVANMRAL